MLVRDTLWPEEREEAGMHARRRIREQDRGDGRVGRGAWGGVEDEEELVDSGKREHDISPLREDAL